MLKSKESLQFICKSCQQSTLRSRLPTRSFSNSASRSNTIPDFQPTSIPQLDAIFADWRKRVFTPAALGKTHRDLVYKKSRHALLVNDPGVTVTMTDGEEVRLMPLIAFDKPNKRKSLSTISRILGSTESKEAPEVWTQLAAFLEGMRTAKQEVPVWFLEKIARKANKQGKAGMFKQSAVMVKKTGLSLSIRPVTRELFLGCHERLIEARMLGTDGVEKEQKFAENLALMLESEHHCGGTLDPSKDQVDMRKDLLVIGVLLELAASVAIRNNNGKDVNGKISNLAQKLIAVADTDILRREEKPRTDRAVEEWIPLADGIRLTLQVDGLLPGRGRNAEAELKNVLKNRLDDLDAAIKDGISQIEAEAGKKQRRPQAMLANIRQAGPVTRSIPS